MKYKFKLWDKREKKWMTIRSIGLHEDGSIFYIQCWDESEKDIDPPYFMDNLGVDFELVQYTGLKDRNGCEIYEGYIVKAWDRGVRGTFQVKWRSEGVPMYILSPAWRNGEFWDLYNNGSGVDGGIKIIGNIFEHSYLLKGE